MEGVQVLNIVEYDPYAVQTFILFITGCVCLIVCYAGYVCKKIIIMILSIIAVLLSAFGMMYFENKELGYRYEVIIDKLVTHEKLTEKFKIVEQRGDIWVLEEKEPNKTSLLSGGEGK